MGEVFTKTVTRNIGKADIEQRKMRLVDACIELDNIKAEKAEQNQDANKRMKDTRTEIRALTKSIKAGQIETEIECEERVNEKKKTMETVSVDTGEVVDSRPLTAEERTLAFDFEKSGESNGHKKPKRKRAKKTEEAQPEA